MNSFPNHLKLSGFYIMSLLSFISAGHKFEISFAGLKSRCWQARAPSGEFIVFHITSSGA